MGGCCGISVTAAGRRAFLAGCLVLSAVASATGQVTRVSVATDGSQANDSSFPYAITPDGRLVLFHSNATNLSTLGGGTFVRDLVAGTTTRVELPPLFVALPVLSDDGRFIAFVTNAALVAEDTALCPVFRFPQLSCDDAYVLDRQTGLYSLISRSTAGEPGNSHSSTVDLSGDGRYVVFSSNASNLVPGDTNGTSDVFVRDRQTGETTRVSVGAGGVQADAYSSGGAVSGDGRFVAFSSTATNLAPVPPCEPLGTCTRVFVADRQTGAIDAIVPVDVMPESAPYGITDAVTDISADGRWLAMTRSMPRLLLTSGPAFAFDRATRRTTTLVASNTAFATPRLSSTGRHAVLTLGTSTVTTCRLIDLVTNLTEDVGSMPGSACRAPGITADGRMLFGSDDATLVTEDTNSQADVFLLNRDSDGDGMPSSWETLFSLSPTDPADALADSDGDGISNVAEFRQGGHPRASLARYFAEGAANGFFSVSLDVFNPTASAAAVVLHALGANLESTHLTMTIPPGARQWIRPGTASQGRATGWPVPADSFAITLESDRLIVVEREMSWPRDHYGSHAETAQEAPARTWYFAEGATHGGFDLFYLLQNPGSARATVSITYLRPLPLPALVRTYAVAPQSRLTIYVDQEPDLTATDVAAIIESDEPVLAERAMYFSTPSTPFAAGTVTAGVTAPGVEWFLAEGATGTFFDCYILLANPSASSDASVEVSYLLPDGSAFTKTYPVAARSRRTISVDDEDPRLAHTPVSAVVRSINGVGIVVDRAMWWPSGAWYEGHSAAGATQTATRWAVAGAVIDPAVAADSYLLIGNPGTVGVQARVRLTGLGESEAFSCDHIVPVPARGRSTVSVRAVCGAAATAAARFSGTVESEGGPVVVERSTYANGSGGIFWSAGSSLVLARLP
jgi:Tol biopolymer transport system component